MKCHVCSAEAVAGAVFCPQCGANLPLADSSGTKPSPPSSAGPAGARSPAESNATAANAALPLGRRRVTDVPEETLWEGGFSPKAMLGTIVFCAIVSVGLVVASVEFSTYWIVPIGVMLVLWLIVLAQFANRRLGVHYKLTNQMFYHQKGVLMRTTDRIEAIDIDDVTWSQGLIERMVNVGTVEILSRDRTNPKFWLRGIENVQQVAQMIDKARRAERLRRGFLSVQEQNVDAGA